MAKKTLTIRDFTKGLNTESSPRDIEDNSLARSVGVSIERPGIVRPLGKANSQAGDEEGGFYSFLDDNGNNVGTSAFQDPGHGLYSFSYTYNHGERAGITKVYSNHNVSSSITYVELDMGIGTDISQINIVSGDIVRIYGKTADKELNNRYFEVRSIDSSNNYVYLKVVKDGSSKEFSLLDEDGRRVADTIIDTGGALNGSMSSVSAGDETTVAVSSPDSDYAGIDLFSFGDYVLINQEAMKITAMDTSAKTITFKRGELGSTVASHSASSNILKFSYGPRQSGEGGIEQITDDFNRDFSASNNWATYGTSTISWSSGGEKLTVTLAGNGTNSGTQIASAKLDGPSEGKAFVAGRKYRIRANLKGVSDYENAQFAFGLGNTTHGYIKSITENYEKFQSGTVSGSKAEYYADIIPDDTSGALLIFIRSHSNQENTVFEVDDVSVKEVDSLGTGSSDGYIEKVPQRSFTKYIACQSAETINLYVNDTTNPRINTSGWFENIADLKDDFNGSTLASSIGLDTLGSHTEEMMTKGIMPTYFFGETALRVSPANKIGLDDTNYSPRWYGHIKRDKLFGADYSVNYLNEWYKDTIGIKRPVGSGGSSTEELFRYGLNITNDYSKNNNQGLTWGNNWFSEYYLKSHRDIENPAIAVMQDVDYWENEEDAAEAMNKKLEVENDELDSIPYEISSGQLYRNRGHTEHSRDNSTFTDTEFWRIRRNAYSRTIALKTYIKDGESGTVATGDGALQALKVDDSSKLTEGRFYLLHKPNETYIKTIMELDEIVDDETIKVYFWREGIQISNGSSDVTWNENDQIAEVHTYRFTKPNAFADLCQNNSGGGFMGAYTDCDGKANTYDTDAARLYGGVSWIGPNGYANANLYHRRKIVTLTYNTGEDPGVPGKATVTDVTRSGFIGTFTTKTAHGFSTEDRVTVDGTTNFNWLPHSSGPDQRIGSVPSTTSFTIDSTGGDNTGSDFDGFANEADITGSCRLSRRGLPGIVNTKDSSLDNTNWIYHNSTEQNNNYFFQSRNVAKNLVIPGRAYYVTFSVRNFWQTGNGKIRVTVGQTLSELESAGNPTDEYYDIQGNAYKMTIEIKAPDIINEENKHMGVNFEIYGNGDLDTYPKIGTIGSTSANDSTLNGHRTLLGDISLVSKDRIWSSGTSTYVYPKTSVAFGMHWTYGIEGDSWGLNTKSYDFYVTYLYDGGGTPQESSPRYLRSRNNLSSTAGLRISASMCYSSLGDVYDMFNKRITGVRLYFKATDSVESDKLQALLDVDFIRGIRKSNNANFVPWEEDYSGQWEKSTSSDKNDFSYVQDMPIGPYKQAKPSNQGSHINGYFRFDSPPSVLDYETLNASQPFEKGDFYAQYKTIALLKGKSYIANFSILPNGLTSTPAQQSFDYYPGAILASEEGCYDKFPFETKWINMPIENDDSPIVKLESFNEHLVIHKELSTYIINFKDENKPSLAASLSTSGITWQCQSIATSVGVFWANRYGCFYFNGEKISNLISGKISKSVIGWPNNDSDLYYWNIEANTKSIPSLAFDEVNGQLLVIRNSRNQNEGDGDEIWIYDITSKSWTSDRGSGTGYSQDKNFLAPLLANNSYRTNFISESGKKIIYLDNRNPNGTIYNFTKWDNQIYVLKDNAGDIVKADKRPLEIMTKELDFGNPHTKKRIYQVFVTYRMTNTLGSDDGGGEDTEIDIDVDYGLDGGSIDNDFQQSIDNSFENSFSNTDGLWKIATLVGQTSIECFTFQLKISTHENYSPHDFEINDITFVYREKNIRTKVKE